MEDGLVTWLQIGYQIACENLFGESATVDDNDYDDKVKIAKSQET